MRRALNLWPGLLAALAVSAAGDEPDQHQHLPLPDFDRVVIDGDFPGGYQVEAADVNGDGRPDLVGLGGGTCAWFENPSWNKHIITTPETTPGIISSASADLDGDGRAEVAIAYDFVMAEPSRGKLGLAIQGESSDDPWTFRHLADVGGIHRLRLGDVDGDGHRDLVVAPIFGPDSAAPHFARDAADVLVARRFDDPPGRWEPELAGKDAVLHAIDVLDFDDDGRAEILLAGNSGVTLLEHAGDRWSSQLLVPGAEGEAPDRGCSEIHVGQLADGRRFLVTIEPWHGNQVVVYPTDAESSSADVFNQRVVLDDTLDQGHALWVADVDGDGDDEVFAGHRGDDHRVSAYDFNGSTWRRAVLDRDIAAQDLRGADLNADGVPDVVSIGGATHNVIEYRPHPADRD